MHVFYLVSLPFIEETKLSQVLFPILCLALHIRPLHLHLSHLGSMLLLQIMQSSLALVLHL